MNILQERLLQFDIYSIVQYLIFGLIRCVDNFVKLWPYKIFSYSTKLFLNQFEI